MHLHHECVILSTGAAARGSCRECWVLLGRGVGLVLLAGRMPLMGECTTPSDIAAVATHPPCWFKVSYRITFPFKVKNILT